MMATMNGNGENGHSLPDGWEWKVLSDVSISQSGAGFPKTYQGETEGAYPFAKVSDISNAVKNNGGSLTSAVNYLSAATARKIHAKEFPIGTTLFAKIGEAVRLNRRAFASVSVLADNNVMGLIPNIDIVSPKFLYHFMHTVELYEYSQATTVPSVRKSDVEQIPFPLAPLSEQERIVTRLEEMFSDLDAGVAALERVCVGLKRYKASVLKAACEGNLVEQDANDVPAHVLYKKILEERRNLWESQLVKKGKAKNTKYSEPELPEIEDENLPNGWMWTSLDSLTYRVTYGITVRPKYVEEGVSIISAREIRSGEIDLEISHKISTEDYEKLRHNCILYYDDVLFSKTGTIGHVARVKHDMPLSVSQNVAVLSPVVWSKYLEMVLRSPIIQRLAQSKIKTTAIPDLQLGLMKKFPIPLPPLDEQRRIVAEVERRLSVVGEVESAVEVGLVRAGRLRQSVLRSAFEGRL
ncbi:MAG: restriction endonuclease subunit S [Chloroflexi bacterium]|nr:restriction endonuclease subunit S [Chloroflexota bacterium]